jgi:uncharacterized RDD family membrane protein YckC
MRQCPMEPPPSPPPSQDSASDVHLAASLITSGSESPAKPARNGELADEEWRHELSQRLNRYRSRRKAPPPRYPSLKLPFGPAAPVLNTAPPEPSVHSFEPVANQALALDAGAVEHASPEPTQAPPREDSGAEMRQGNPHPSTSSGQAIPPRRRDPSASLRAGVGPQTSAKIIEFPRFAWGPPPPPPDQLAEPVIDRPRILEVPEVAPPPPALGGITITPAPVEQPEKRPGIDTPLQSAPLARRVLALLVDGVILAAASALFGFIFWKITLVRPPQVQLLSLAAGIPALFWAVYQYLLIVYAGTTPGLRLARLQLSRFDGSLATRSLRRWRVLASYLSAASLGMGYAWLFLDEEGLCWHDRITRTYLAPPQRSLTKFAENAEKS